MADVLRKEGQTYFDPKLVSELFNLVKGKSSIARLVPTQPIRFNGNKQFTFSFDNDISIVGESQRKPAGGISIEPVVMIPLKVVYQARVTDEFLYATEEEQIDILKAYSEGYAAKIARGIDLMIMHGVNPATGLPSGIIGNNHLDHITRNRTVIYNHGGALPDKVLDEAMAMIDNPNGILMGKAHRQDISDMRATGGDRLYPEFAWGAAPQTIGSCGLSVNETVQADNPLVRSYVGDFSALKWGMAKEIPLEVIEYGDPDGQGDLKNTNEVLLRSEAYVGWAFMTEEYFSRVARSDELAGYTAEAEAPTTSLLGKLASELQEGIVINPNDRIQGKLKYVTGYTGFSGDEEEQSGNYIALKFGADTGAVITTELLGGKSEGSPVTLDEDRNVVYRITDAKKQKIRVIATTSTESITKVYSLVDLVCEKAQ